MTDKIQQARRELFEAWYRIEFPALELRVQNLIGTYTKYHADLSWQAFNAALDAVVIELPESCRQVTIDDESIDIYWPNEVRAAIESTNLGIKVK